MMEHTQAVNTVGEGTPREEAHIASEKMLPQSEVNKLVGDAKLAAYERGVRAAQVQPANQAPTMGEPPQQNPEHIRKAVEEQLQRSQQELANQQQLMYHQQVEQELVGKLKAATPEYPDLEPRVSALNLRNIPNVIHLANSMGNTADVIHELADNPLKAHNLHQLALSNYPAALLEMQKLSKSVAANKEAVAKAKPVGEPLSQVTPSMTGSDSGKMTVRDYRRQPYNRG